MNYYYLGISIYRKDNAVSLPVMSGVENYWKFFVSFKKRGRVMLLNWFLEHKIPTDRLSVVSSSAVSVLLATLETVKVRILGTRKSTKSLSMVESYKARVS